MLGYLYLNLHMYSLSSNRGSSSYSLGDAYLKFLKAAELGTSVVNVKSV